MSLVSIIFFLAGRLCCRANFIFAADLTLRGQLKLTCFRHIDYKCNYFLSFLFLTGFISDAMQFKHFLWLRFEDHGVYMMNLYWKEFAPLPDCRWERGCAPGWRRGGGRWGYWGGQPTRNLTFSGFQMSICALLDLQYESNSHPGAN